MSYYEHGGYYTYINVRVEDIPNFWEFYKFITKLQNNGDQFMSYRVTVDIEKEEFEIEIYYKLDEIYNPNKKELNKTIKDIHNLCCPNKEWTEDYTFYI